MVEEIEVALTWVNKWALLEHTKHFRKIRSPIFFHIENTFIGNECYIDGKTGLSAIFRRNHRCDPCIFACAVAFLLYPCHRTLMPCCQSDSYWLQRSIRTAHELSHANLQTFFILLHFCNCFGQNWRPTRTLFIIDVCTSAHELSDTLSHIFDVHTLWSIDFA